MKNKFRILTALMLIMIMTFGINLEAYAVSVTYDSTITRRADLPNEVASSGEPCSGVQAMGVSRGKNCLYSIKINSSEASAIMHYFPDISDWNNYNTFSLYNVGHANGMTVDTDYIYIAAALTNAPAPNNRIIRISRTYIESLNDDAIIPTTSTSEADYKIMQPKKINPNASVGDSNYYVNYISTFRTITRDETTGTFIIGKSISGVTGTDYNGFTRARIIDGEFVVSTDPEDMFIIENNLLYKDAAKQDMCFVSGYGLFIGRWYRSIDSTLTDAENQYRNPTKNVVLWVDIEGTPDYQYMGYDCYVPDKIRVDMTDHQELGVDVYKVFEIESLGITKRGNLIANFNVEYTTAYVNAYNAKYGTKITAANGDGIYKITKTDGSTFVLS